MRWYGMGLMPVEEGTPAGTSVRMFVDRHGRPPGSGPGAATRNADPFNVTAFSLASASAADTAERR
jgi:hypothetical protein